MSIERFRTHLQPHIDSGAVPSVLAILSSRAGQDVFAAAAPSAADTRIEADSLVRITSWTKPIAAVATLILAERHRVSLDDEVERFLPELADRRVLRRVDGDLDDVTPAERPITIRHLLTGTMGFGFPMTKGPHPVMKAAADLQVAPGPPKPRTPHTPDEWLRRFSTLPLMAAPGTTWMYDTSFTVLGALLSRAGGGPLGDVLRDLVFDPLGMADTSFSVPAEKRSRLVPCARAAGTPTVFDGVNDSQWATPPPFPDAAGGLVSTANDFLRFAHMLLAGGALNGRRVLSEASVAHMTTNQLLPSHRGPASTFLDRRGWGFGVSVALAPDDEWSRAGRYGWDGGLGTSWFNDSRAAKVALLVTQRFPPAFEVFVDFWKAVSTD